ncbi:Fe-S cluster assembly protein SufB [Candidatus Woesearchaeota archaeon CG1_02_57_44]|nr:MAG: Fe-S cluster assembly protein SufB [Candidatus Woesearchaeota archaeon CG1_02_57_44]PIN68412.1 MAG: Fe-S cluster assembly protein SufB [Candidatus Woesearchaeota archaeon CG11_big_fil_rev_8_21_14_0_20_57_5]
MQLSIAREMFDHKNPVLFTKRAPPGITEDVVRMISKEKNEPDWMLQKRLAGLKAFKAMPLPEWGPHLQLDLDKITYYLRAVEQTNEHKWDNVPDDIKRTFQKLGIPEAEQKALAGAGAQYESEVVYHHLKEEWSRKGVIFENMDVALRKYPELVKKHFMTRCVPITDHKFAALHAAVWSGGTFIYVPPGVSMLVPMQAYFRMNSPGMGQFEHTLIIVDKSASVHYIEGCSAPQYSVNNLHAGCVEIFVYEHATARYSSVENWSKNTFNLNTKRAIVEEAGVVEWVNGNLGSNVTMLYPCSVLKGDRSRADFLGVAFAGPGQNQDTGSKVIHLGKDTSSTITSKSISSGGGITMYRGLLRIAKGASNAKNSTNCDALMMDPQSRSGTIPVIQVSEETADIAHEATVGRISEEQVFYLMTRGLSQEEAVRMIVSGFMEPILRALPMEYAVELNRLIELEMEGSIG